MLCYTNMHICIIFSALKKDYLSFESKFNSVFQKDKQSINIITRISYINVIFLDAYIILACVYIVMIYLFLFQHPRKTFRYRSSPSLLFTRRMTWSSNAPLQTRHSSVLCITYNFIGTVAPALILQYQYLETKTRKFSGPRDQHYKTGPLQ